ncbi:hypothetical protein HNP40_002816 [Mycobacteroides chelonae]|nr:hypothetical protein [Mycobacteroides chelonae]
MPRSSKSEAEASSDGLSWSRATYASSKLCNLLTARSLADLSIGAATLPEGRLYASLVKAQLTFPAPAPLARDDSAAAGLWRVSAEMVGLEAP